MSNMSYCRFQNTDKDLTDCAEVLEDLLSADDAMGPLSREERRAAANLVSTCINVANLFADHLNLTFDELMDTNCDELVRDAIEDANAQLKNEEDR